MLQRGHRVYFLNQALLELGVFDHLFLGKALDGVGDGGAGGFGGEEDVSEASLADFADAVELVGVQDIAGL